MIFLINLKPNLKTNGIPLIKRLYSKTNSILNNRNRNDQNNRPNNKKQFIETNSSFFYISGLTKNIFCFLNLNFQNVYNPYYRAINDRFRLKLVTASIRSTVLQTILFLCAIHFALSSHFALFLINNCVTFQVPYFLYRIILVISIPVKTTIGNMFALHGQTTINKSFVQLLEQAKLFILSNPIQSGDNITYDFPPSVKSLDGWSYFTGKYPQLANFLVIEIDNLITRINLNPDPNHQCWVVVEILRNFQSCTIEKIQYFEGTIAFHFTEQLNLYRFLNFSPGNLEEYVFNARTTLNLSSHSGSILVAILNLFEAEFSSTGTVITAILPGPLDAYLITVNKQQYYYSFSLLFGILKPTKSNRELDGRGNNNDNIQNGANAPEIEPPRGLSQSDFLWSLLNYTVNQYTRMGVLEEGKASYILESVYFNTS